ncbi:MAG: monofunctional biosynthetic peptidoglycan transglycosylase [Phycisphaerales bacterium]|nr:monofunctional biosynthetic peptidoglycan transglycosylase [Phycisphaerales bacterium]
MFAVLRLLAKLLMWFFISSFCYILLCIYIFPPITITQIYNGFYYGLHQKSISWHDIPASVKLAALASEDQSFPYHNGIDWEAVQKSIEQHVSETGKKSKRKKLRPLGAGTSTISQQTAKNVFLWQGDGWTKYVRKFLEVYFTKMIEYFWGKKRILEVYLNVIEMGPGIFGIEAASEYYFHIHANKLSPKQAAMIISCLPNPKKFTIVPISPRVAYRYPQVLEQMNNLEDDAGVMNLVNAK